ncbi:MAG: endolytic transglycosylase MltG [Desulfobacterales bacterium]|nr:MAG: endolytic transglycosylase MltG [Desulfobacterales bacterium]
MKKFVIIIAVSTFLALCVAGGAYLDLKAYGVRPANSSQGSKIITFHPGLTFKTATRILYQNEIIKHPKKFELLARIKGYDKQLKAGEYLLSSTMTPLKILDKIVKGTVILHKLTVPEGYNLYQIAEIVATEGFGTEADFIKAATDPAFARRNGIEADSLEGYLFPDTYYFRKGVSIETIITTMVDRFRSVFQEAWAHQASNLGLSIHQVVTLASIIEKETGTAFERPLISSVFHNRLKRKMRLETDPTVIYGLKNFDGNITREHLETPSPYNTYKIQGLPPGPIANPGIASIEAALHPTDTSFLYFVSKKDKTHQFSNNLTDHNRAVRKYQLNR